MHHPINVGYHLRLRENGRHIAVIFLEKGINEHYIVLFHPLSETLIALYRLIYCALYLYVLY